MKSGGLSLTDGILLSGVLSVILLYSTLTTAAVPFTDFNSPVVVQGESSEVDLVDMNGTATLTTLFGPLGIEFNNVGYRSTDGLLYAVKLNYAGYRGGNDGIISIDAAGNWVALGVPVDASLNPMPSGTPVFGEPDLAARFDAGDISSDGNTMYITFGADANDTQALYRNNLYIVDLPSFLLGQPSLTVRTITGDNAWVNDWAYNPNDGLLYGGDQLDGQLSVLDPNTGVRTDYDIDDLPAGPPYSSAWWDTTRNTLFLYREHKGLGIGRVCEIDVIAKTVLNEWDGPIASHGDGAFITPEPKVYALISFWGIVLLFRRRRR